MTVNFRFTNKQKLIIFVIFTFILFLGGAVYLFHFLNKEKENVVKKEEITKEVETVKETRKEEIINEVKVEELIKECEKIEDKFIKWLCYYAIGKIKPDPSICNKIQDEEMKYMCSFGVAVAQNDVSFCEEMPLTFVPEICYLEIAKNKKDFSVCERAGIEGLGGVGEVIRVECIDHLATTLAIETKDLSLCDRIQTEKIKYFKCYTGVATISKDISICDKIQEEIGKDWCYINVNMAISKEDVSFCEKISDWIRKHACYSLVLNKESDLSVCDNAHNKIHKIFCYYHLAVIKQNTSICDKILDPTLIKELIKELDPTLKKEKEIKKELEELKDECYGKVTSAISMEELIKQAISDCEKIPGDEEMKYFCYYRVTFGFIDPFLCREALDPKIKIECFYYFGARMFF